MHLFGMSIHRDAQNEHKQPFLEWVSRMEKHTSLEAGIHYVNLYLCLCGDRKSEGSNTVLAQPHSELTKRSSHGDVSVVISNQTTSSDRHRLLTLDKNTPHWALPMLLNL